MRIAVVAPSSRFEDWQAVRDQVGALAAARHSGLEVHFHPQCGLVDGHFAGTDAQRTDALVEVANDPSFDAIWFARGGYGSNRIAEAALARFGPAARDKAWLGYSDAGFLLAGLYRAGYADVAHGPMPRDVSRKGGEAAVGRALDWLAERSPHALEPGLDRGKRHAAFNLTVLGMLLGTALEPDLADHVLIVEEVSEHLYAIDRAMFHLSASANLRRVAGLRLGRVSDVLSNDPEFGEDAETIVRHWCERAGIPFFGRADIGHDAANKVVPFGRV
ncbi:MAG TPA: LD-carboxypeptidase [Allosphingosinicella sp.]|nr:LD-carboxypeptidase [Allosphingosinicella sp.]